MTLIHDVRLLIRYREVLSNLVKADLKLRYRRTILGYAWTLLYPLATMAIMTIVFSRALGFDDWTRYARYVFAGLLPWNFLMSAMWGAGTSIVWHEDLLKKIYLPKHLFPVAITLARFYDFLFNFAVLFLIIMPFVQYHPAPALLALPLAIAILLLFIAGIGFAVSTLNVYIRDTTHLMSVMMQLGFYLTPIIYDVEHAKIPEKWRFVFELNPMTHMIRPFQDIISNGEFPTPQRWGAALAIALGTFIIGHLVYAALERKLIFRL
jgi:ABC-type polysaccharide/polyol phosphate export permease